MKQWKNSPSPIARLSYGERLPTSSSSFLFFFFFFFLFIFFNFIVPEILPAPHPRGRTNFAFSLTFNFLWGKPVLAPFGLFQCWASLWPNLKLLEKPLLRLRLGPILELYPPSQKNNNNNRRNLDLHSKKNCTLCTIMLNFRGSLADSINSMSISSVTIS